MVATFAAFLLAFGPPGANGTDAQKAQQALRWAPGTLAGATGKGKPIVVVVHASWCEPCNELDKQVLDTDAGRRLLQRVQGFTVDYDTDEGQAFTRQFAVLDLPTTLVLTADGKQKSRIAGFDGPEKWLSEVDAALGGTGEVNALAAALADEPGDRQVQVALAQARLTRGEEEAARALLFEQIRQGGSPGLDAGRIWGRYLIRVKRDGVRGAAHFAELVKRFRGHKEVDGFRYWTAVGHHVAGAPKAALAVFDQWVADEPRNDGASLAKAEFMVNFRYDSAAAQEAVYAAMAVNPESATPYYLLAELQLRSGDRAGAATSIKRAIAMEAGNALFEHFATRRLGLEL